MYFGVIVVPPTLPPVMYVSTARGDIRHPGGFSCLSAATIASISCANSTSAGARSTAPAAAAPAPLVPTGCSSAAVSRLAISGSSLGLVLQLHHGLDQLVHHLLGQRRQERLELRVLAPGKFDDHVRVPVPVVPVVRCPCPL